MSWKTLETDIILKDKFVTVKKNKVELSDGAVIPDFYTVTIHDAAMVVALTADGGILLKKEYRYACGEDVIECPAGMFEEGEEPFDTAKRELLEETGYTSDVWTYLGETWESTSKLTNRMHLFLAKDCVKISEQKLDENEQVDVMIVPFEKAIDMVMSNEICANSSAHAILKAARLLNM